MEEIKEIKEIKVKKPRTEKQKINDLKLKDKFKTYHENKMKNKIVVEKEKEPIEFPSVKKIVNRINNT